MRISGTALVALVLGVKAFDPREWAFASSSGAGTVAAGVQQVLDSSSSSSNSKVEYSPLRPPAIPLAVRGVYTNIWQNAANDATLNDGDANSVIFWNGRQVGWTGFAAVDGQVYRWMGAGATDDGYSATPISVKFDSQWTNYTFECGSSVQLHAQFFSPVTPEDVCRMSIPLSYLTVEVETTDGKEHDVQLYNDVGGAWVTSDADAQLTWSTGDHNNLHTFYARREAPILFGEHPDQGQSQYGNLTFTSSQQSAKSLSLQVGSAAAVQSQFTANKQLTNTVSATSSKRSVDSEIVFAFSHDLGSVETSTVMYTVGMVHEPVVMYLGKNGIEHLDPWWKECYGDGVQELIDFHYHDYQHVSKLGYEYEQRLQRDVSAYFEVDHDSMDYTSRAHCVVDDSADTNEYNQQYLYNPDNGFGYLDAGEPHHGAAVPGIREENAYYAIVALSSRQFFASKTFTRRPLGHPNPKEPYLFSKETSSDANMNTADLFYPYAPFTAYANPDLQRYVMDPVLDMVEGGFYPNKYAIHDIGAWYPNATGHIDGKDEYMPVEESGNLITSLYSYFMYSQDLGYLKAHYPLMRQYAEYLVEFSLTPDAQISTDDFAGPLVNQTNLAIKGIVGLQAMSKIAETVGNGADSERYSRLATEYYKFWKQVGVDPANQYTLLSYNWRSSWGQLYNVFPAKWLGLDQQLVAQTYQWNKDLLTRTQKFGIPLDSRHTWTKSDWLVWTAGLSDKTVRRTILTSLAFYLDSTNTGRPFVDLFDTDTGEFPTTGPYFINRPVCGGHFALLALGKKTD